MARMNTRVGQRQRGAVLITGLIILALLMLISASAVMMANTQFKVAGNSQFQNLAMSDAENAVASAENWLNANSANAAFGTADMPGTYPYQTTIDPLTMTWNDSNSVRLDAAGNQRYTIELYMAGRTLPTNSVGQCNSYGMVAPCPKVNLYRITGRGVSRAGATSIVQSFYALRATGTN